MRLTRRAWAGGMLGVALGGMRAGGSAANEAPPMAFEPDGQTAVTLNDPVGIYIDHKDQLYVAGAEGVDRYDSNGQRNRRIETTGAARAVAVDESGQIYVAQQTRIEKFSADGQLITAWGESGRGDGQFSYVTSLDERDGFLFIADAGNRRIYRFAGNGVYVDAIEKFAIPSYYFDVTLGPDDHYFYVTHTGRRRVERYDRNMKRVDYWGESGAGASKFFGCCNPTHLTVFKDGRVATAEKGIPRIKVYDPKGAMLAHLGQEAFPKESVHMDLATDSRERLAVLVPKDRAVRFYRIVTVEAKKDMTEKDHDS